MFAQGGLNLNLNFGNQGIQGPHGHHGPRGPRGGGRQMRRMMRQMQQMMQQMTGQGQGQCCCNGNRPSFGQGQCQQQGGLNFHMGASIQGFLG